MDYNGRASLQFRGGSQTSANGGRGRQVPQQKAPDYSDMFMRLVSGAVSSRSAGAIN